jgi:hypothetical protein
MSEWERDAAGNVVLHPLAGFSTAVPAGMAVMARLELVPDAAALSDGRRVFVQTVMQPAQARELAEALRRAANEATRPRPPSRT